MRPAREWRGHLPDPRAGEPPLALERARDGAPTLRAGEVHLHSRYAPRDEAARLAAAAGLDPARPVAVVGLGLGHHVAALRDAGFGDLAAFEADPRVAALALEAGVLPEDTPLAVGPVDAWRGDPAFRAFAARMPQILTHPPSARVSPGFAGAAAAAIAAAGIGARRLRIAVVGPLYGGSLPIAGYLARAFRSLGHEAIDIDNSAAWPLYESVTGGVRDRRAADQLGQMLGNTLAEWTYARVAECAPDLCVVLAQAPVGPAFPGRLAEHGIVSAFWYVENWRHLPYWRDIAPHYDYFFHIQPGEFERQLDAAGCARHAFVQTGCDPELHRPVTLAPDEAAAYACDLSFAGAGYANRLALFRGLIDHNFKIWGVEWPEPALARRLVGGERRFDHETFMKIVAGSRINLNLHSSARHDGVDPACDAINPRVFEIAAAGGFQLCDPCAGLDAHFDPATELPTYHDLASLRARIDHFLAHPDERAAFAARARERALREHTYAHRARRMIDLILEAHGPRILARGVPARWTAAEAAERPGIDPGLAAWLRSLPPGTPFNEEGLRPQTAAARPGAPLPERICRYMHEVRAAADTLFEARQ